MMEFLTANAMYVVLISALLIWIGIAWYLTRLDRRMQILEQKIGSSS